MKQFENRPCKYAEHWNEVLGEKWAGSCPMFECNYDGDLNFWDNDNFVCNEDNTCPAYHPVPLYYCYKHHEIYHDECSQCEADMWDIPELTAEEIEEIELWRNEQLRK